MISLGSPLISFAKVITCRLCCLTNGSLRIRSSQLRQYSKKSDLPSGLTNEQQLKNSTSLTREQYLSLHSALSLLGGGVTNTGSMVMYSQLWTIKGRQISIC